ncbi:hypothetical protein [Aquibacillus saliphilus]|uniref:hypothetical protein n=1 Tax=Aquibacillus saliphilus TaxID=1909422 RepID=UPI001CF064AE|nr:hypothetical protein [Aquibacillus saliphilus]
MYYGLVALINLNNSVKIIEEGLEIAPIGNGLHRSAFPIGAITGKEGSQKK